MDFLTLFLMIVAGFLLGLLYFQGMWMTVRSLMKGNKKSLPRFLASFFLRTALLAVAFYLLMAHDWRRIIALAVGFTVARFVVVGRVKRTPTQESGG